ncbi:MAG: LysM peptidoglycan-binding domain-containing protein [Desulfobacterales bacterium]|nr:MAG: LysM peptidoglycan-binding domain-containing protein [Desulfobacterales bacterium]
MQTYKVKSGDTLAKIAKKFYGDAQKYMLIAKANDIRDPNKIKVGQVLDIPFDRGDISDSTDLMTIQAQEIPIDRTSMRLPEGQYIVDPKPKNLIVLHFTAGTTARSAFNTWMADSLRIAAAYIVDADSSIYELFDPQCWAFALGIKGQPGYPNEKRAIQIEIANVGPLKRRDDMLCWWPPENSFKTRWCHVDEDHKYVKASHRGCDYYAGFPDIQFLSVCNLVKYLCERFEIPKDIPKDKLDICDLDWFTNYEGIASHQNFRTDKYDIGPAFDWERFEDFIT